MPLVSAAPTIERPGVIAGFVLSIWYGLTPAITKGLLFAQDTMYRPATAPSLPEAPASQQSWLCYNSAAGFYWSAAPAPYLSDDALVGWVLAGETEILAVSSQRIQTEPAEESPAVIPVIVSQPPTFSVPNVVLFKAGRSNGDGTFTAEMYWDATRGVMLIDWGCLAPSDTSNWLGLQIWLKIPDGEAVRYVKTGGTIGIDQFAEAEGSSRYRYDTLAIQLESIPEDPEEWLIIAASVDASGALKVDGEGNPSGPYVALVTLDKSDYAQAFDAEVATQLLDSGEEVWGISSSWENPPVPRYVKTRILLLDYQFEGSVQQLSGDNPLTDLDSLCGFWGWPDEAKDVRVVIQSLFGDGTVAAIEDCPYVDLVIDRTLGTAGQEYCGLVSGITLSNGAYATNPDGQKVFRCVITWTPPSDVRYGGGSLWIIRSGVHHPLGALDKDRFEWESSHWPTTAENVTFYVLSVDTLNRRNTYQAGVTPTLAYTWNPPTLGSAGSEYTSQVTGFSVTVTYPEQADGTYRAVLSCAFTKSSVASWGALSIQIKPSGGSFEEFARGSITPITFTLPVGIVATTFTVGAFSVDVNGHVNSYQAGVTPTQDIIIGSAAGQFDASKLKPTSYDSNIFKIQDGKFQIWAYDGSLLVSGSVGSAALNTTVINVGGGGGKPGKFAVYNASGQQIAHIGVEDGYDSWFKSVGIGGSSKAVPKITASSAGAVAIDGASITVTASITGGGTQVASLDPTSTVAPIRVYRQDWYETSLTAGGITLHGNGSTAEFPTVHLGRGSAAVNLALYGDESGDRYLYLVVNASSDGYMDLKGVALKVGGTTIVDTARNAAFANLYFTGQFRPNTVVSESNALGGITSTKYIPAYDAAGSFVGKIPLI